jgi:hypothetical protein
MAYPDVALIVRFWESLIPKSPRGAISGAMFDQTGKCRKRKYKAQKVGYIFFSYIFLSGVIAMSSS